jgi:hypothetical protein
MRPCIKRRSSRCFVFFGEGYSAQGDVEVTGAAWRAVAAPVQSRFHAKNVNANSKFAQRSVYRRLRKDIRDPFQGVGNPEPLRYVLEGCW